MIAESAGSDTNLENACWVGITALQDGRGKVAPFSI